MNEFNEIIKIQLTEIYKIELLALKICNRKSESRVSMKPMPLKEQNYSVVCQKIKRGVRQGCVLSPDLFSLYSEIIIRNIEGQPGIREGGHNINNLRCADDTVLISENEKDLQQLLNIVESKSKEKGPELNSKKTEVMVISRKEEPPLINITINGIKLKQRDHFKYLGALISSDGRNNTEISARIAQAKMMFQKMKTVLKKLSHINSNKKKNPWMLHRTHTYVRMRGLDNIQTGTEKTRGSRNLVPEKNDENIMDG